jgi:hypothetical protein
MVIMNDIVLRYSNMVTIEWWRDAQKSLSSVKWVSLSSTSNSLRKSGCPTVGQGGGGERGQKGGKGRTTPHNDNTQNKTSVTHEQGAYIT